MEDARKTQGIKVSIYIRASIAEEMRIEGDRLGVSISKLIQDAWVIARESNIRPAGTVLFRNRETFDCRSDAWEENEPIRPFRRKPTSE